MTIKDLAARGAGVRGGLFGKKKEVEQSEPSRLSVRDEKPKVLAASGSFFADGLTTPQALRW